MAEKFDKFTIMEFVKQSVDESRFELRINGLPRTLEHPLRVQWATARVGPLRVRAFVRMTDAPPYRVRSDIQMNMRGPYSLETAPGDYYMGPMPEPKALDALEHSTLVLGLHTKAREVLMSYLCFYGWTRDDNDWMTPGELRPEKELLDYVRHIRVGSAGSGAPQT